MDRTIHQILKHHIALDKETIIARAPGRINLIGEHTDYNQGLVLPAAIDKYCYFAIRFNKTSHISLKAIDLKETHTIDLNNISKTEISWVDYITGILLEFRSLGVELKGMDCVVTSNIPIGAGMSSSAAFDCALITALDKLYNTQMTKWEKVFLSNRSNNNFLGIQSGILDQFASIFGKTDHAIFLNCESKEYSHIPIKQDEYSWVLINTCVKHDHMTSAYNKRVNECQSALTTIKQSHPSTTNLSSIRDWSQIENLEFASDKIRNRARFIIEENNRVREFVERLKQSDYISCGELLVLSHRGLSRDYEVSCDELDYLVTEALKTNACLGARMMGGGFGGCTLNLIKSNHLGEFKLNLYKLYKAKFTIEPEFYEIQLSDGARLID